LKNDRQATNGPVSSSYFDASLLNENQPRVKLSGDETACEAGSSADESHIVISDDSFRLEPNDDQKPTEEESSAAKAKTARPPASAINQRNRFGLAMPTRGILQHYLDHSRWVFGGGIRRRRRPPPHPVPRRIPATIRNQVTNNIEFDGFRRPVGRPRKDGMVRVRQASPRKTTLTAAEGVSSAPVGLLKLLPNVVDPEAVEETIAANENRNVDDCLRSAVQRHFGAAGRLRAGARCRVVARRCTVGDRVEYLVQWDSGIII